MNLKLASGMANSKDKCNESVVKAAGGLPASGLALPPTTLNKQAKPH